MGQGNTKGRPFLGGDGLGLRLIQAGSPYVSEKNKNHQELLDEPATLATQSEPPANGQPEDVQHSPTITKADITILSQWP